MSLSIIENILERRIEFNYEKYGDSPVCLGEEFDLPNQNAFLQGFGQQADESAGELLELELRTLQNEECYDEFVRIANEPISPRRPNRKNGIKTTIQSALYDGITDGILCTTILCDGTNTDLARSAKCVRMKSFEIVVCSTIHLKEKILSI